jgi:hypothetical protein
LQNGSHTQVTALGADVSITTDRTNVTALGYGITNAQCTNNNQVLLGNTSVAQIRAQVSSITAYSDKRFKTNVAEDVKGLDFVMKLRPVSYNTNPELLHRIWGTPDSLLNKIDHSEIKKTRFVGLLAQEVEQAMKESGYTHFPGIDIPKSANETYTLRYGDLILPMIKAMQEQQAKIEALEAENKSLQAQKTAFEQLKAEVDMIKRFVLPQASK